MTNRVSQAPVSGLPRRSEYRLLAMTNSANRVSPSYSKWLEKKGVKWMNDVLRKYPIVDFTKGDE